MKIVLAGAGDIGFHLAELLSSEQQDITLIDLDEEILDRVQQKLDVITVKGDASSPSTLEKANVSKAALFLAVATSEKTNMISCILAKKMGAKQTVARVQNSEYIRSEYKSIFGEIGVDAIFSPRSLAAQEIKRLLKQSTFTDVFEFEQGKFSLTGYTVESYSKILGKSIEEISAHDETKSFRPIAILRGNHSIIPRGNTRIMHKDHVYFLAPKGRINSLLEVIGDAKIDIKKVMIVGGTDVGLMTAEQLEQDYYVKLIDNDKENCKHIAETLNSTLVLHGDPTNFELLKEEGLEEMDCFIAVNKSTETNILSCLMAKKIGISKTIALVENIDYTHLSQNIGIDTLINKKLIAANNIFRFVRKGKIEAITSLHGVDAEVIEFAIHRNNRATKHPLKELRFPQKALIGGVIRDEESHIPDGDFQLAIGDKVIVFALPEAIGKVEEIFR